MPTKPVPPDRATTRQALIAAGVPDDVVRKVLDERAARTRLSPITLNDFLEDGMIVALAFAATVLLAICAWVSVVWLFVRIVVRF